MPSRMMLILAVYKRLSWQHNNVMPGWIEFTRIPRGPSSIAAALVIPRMANFVAVYAVSEAIPARPSTEEALMIDPPPFFLIVRATAFMR